MISSLVFLLATTSAFAGDAEFLLNKTCEHPRSPRLLGKTERLTRENIKTLDSNADQMDVDVFKKAYDKSCDFNLSLDIAKKVQSKEINLSIFLGHVYFFTEFCASTHGTIDPKDAALMAEKATQKKIDVSVFEKIFRSECDSNYALQIAEKAKSGILDLDTFYLLSDTDFRYTQYCSRLHRRLSNEQQEQVAIEVKNQNLDFKKFKASWLDHCDFLEAMHDGKIKTRGRGGDGEGSPAKEGGKGEKSGATISI